jgi:diphthamide biosynthesis protein 2
MDAADVRETAAWVARRGFRRVALQFPDEFLADAVPSTTALQAACGSAVTVFLLADTTFGRRGGGA